MGLKRFLLFQFDSENAYGGWNDFVDSFNTSQEALAAVNPAFDIFHIVDFDTGKKIEVSENERGD